MFATYFAEHNTANIFLFTSEQKRFCMLDDENIYPVPNKWGEKGITTFELDMVSRELVHEALLSAYNEIINCSNIRSLQPKVLCNWGLMEEQSLFAQIPAPYPTE